MSALVDSGVRVGADLSAGRSPDGVVAGYHDRPVGRHSMRQAAVKPSVTEAPLQSFWVLAVFAMAIVAPVEV
jgi:hypothetical protein